MLTAVGFVEKPGVASPSEGVRDSLHRPARGRGRFLTRPPVRGGFPTTPPASHPPGGEQRAGWEPAPTGREPAYVGSGVAAAVVGATSRSRASAAPACLRKAAVHAAIAKAMAPAVRNWPVLWTKG